MRNPFPPEAREVIKAMSPEEFRNFILYCSGVVTCTVLSPEDIGLICEKILSAEVARLVFLKRNNLDFKLWKC